MLEQRLAFDASASASAGLPWFDLGGLTYSFVPDGTELGHHSSSLFAELAPTGEISEWQGEFQRALDAWLGSMGIVARQVPDSGDPFGMFGKTQGDTRFGDIRIGAVPLSNNVMAEAVQHAVVTQGSWAGDILLNENGDWENLQQVFSVALHEIGHVLGLDHSDDPASPMFFHGVYDSTGPTAADLNQLKKLYAGVKIESDDHELSEPADYEWNEEPEFNFDPATAIPLQAVLSASARYSATGTLTDTKPSELYRLDPFGEVDHAEYLNLIVTADQFGGLFPKIEIFDSSGDPIKGRILHYSTGVIVYQAQGVEPTEVYYVAVTPADTAVIHQVGGFEFLAEYSNIQLEPTEVGKFELSEASPIFEQPFTVHNSRLVHVLLDSREIKKASPNSAVWATLVDDAGNILAQLAMNQGQSRSFPLTFLEPGDYRVIVQVGTADGSPIVSQKLTLSIDEISIDVGPGVINPAIQPILPCGSLGANPNNCSTVTPVVINVPVYPDPATLPPNPVYPSIPPFTMPSWYFWPLASYRQNPFKALDVSGDSNITPTDALLIINLLNSTAKNWNYAYDSSGDGRVTPTDALLVINELNSRPSGEGESAQVIHRDPIHSQDILNNLMDEIELLKRRHGSLRHGS